MALITFTLAYDGTDFCGWLRQTHAAKPSVCETVQRALEKVFNEEISLFASGRTDAGVHALNQVCHFDTSRDPERLKNFNLSLALRHSLPSTINIKKAWLAPDDFHSTLSPEGKTYRFLIHNANEPSVFLKRLTQWERRPLDLVYLNECSRQLLGEQDFKSFQSVGSTVTNTVRVISQAEWAWRRPGIAQFTITGSGFLKQMVRNIVGTQLLMLRKGHLPSKLKEIILAQDRKAAGPPSDPQGLYLMRVYYPLDLDNRCREL